MTEQTTPSAPLNPPAHPVHAPFFSRFNRFDRFVGLIMLVLLGAIGLTILLGDRVGVTLERVGPLGTARSTGTITLQFSETMNRDSVPQRLRVVQVAPEMAGQTVSDEAVLATVMGNFTWNAHTLTFRPDAPLLPGATYQVSLLPGAISESGRAILSEYRFSFTVGRPRVAYLAPASSTQPFNIWITDPANGEREQVTFSPSGIYDFSVSPDGSQIAFAEKNSSTGTMDIKLLSLDSGQIEQLTNCLDAECKTPVWRPDGQVIAYERIDYNSDFAQVGVSPNRIWVIDLSTRPATTRPMFSDSQILGYGLDWSKDGQRVSFFDSSAFGILIHDFRDGSSILVPSQYGNPGRLSADGTRIAYPEIVLTENQARSYIQVVDLATQEQRPMTMPDDPADDDNAVWSPDGSYLVVTRRYTDDRYTRGKQLYKMNIADGSVEPLLVDPLYQNGFVMFDPTGTQLVVQRFPDPVAMGDPENPGMPEIWILDMVTREAVKVADDAFVPRWVP